jgi:hypothetical protein
MTDDEYLDKLDLVYYLLAGLAALNSAIIFYACIVWELQQ